MATKRMVGGLLILIAALVELTGFAPHPPAKHYGFKGLTLGMSIPAVNRLIKKTPWQLDDRRSGNANGPIDTTYTDGDFLSAVGTFDRIGCIVVDRRRKCLRFRFVGVRFLRGKLDRISVMAEPDSGRTPAAAKIAGQIIVSELTKAFGPPSSGESAFDETAMERLAQVRHGSKEVFTEWHHNLPTDERIEITVDRSRRGQYIVIIVMVDSASEAERQRLIDERRAKEAEEDEE